MGKMKKILAGIITGITAILLAIWIYWREKIGLDDDTWD